MITIADIVADPSVDSRILCGASGSNRSVSWAHSCEMQNPGRWFQPGELLMTIGLCLPTGSQAQRDFIASLDENGLSGIIIGEDGFAPRITKALIEESEKRGFPVLRAGARTPFAAIGRMVASSNSNGQTLNVMRLARLYQTAAIREFSEKRSGVPLARLFDTTFQVIDDKTGCVVIGTGLIQKSVSRGHPLRTLRETTLVFDKNESIDSFTLLHLSQVLTVDANDVLQSALEVSHEGDALFSQALSNRIGAIDALEARWQQVESYSVVATEIKVEQQLPLLLALGGLQTLATQEKGKQLLLVPSTELERVRSMLSELNQPAASSEIHHDFGDLAGAAEEAVSELAEAAAHGEQWRIFQGEAVSLLARSKSEQSRIVVRVLGPLANATDSKSTLLRETLFTFLDHDLRWSETAVALNLHRQTLVYRLDRVTELTGRSVRNTKDIAEFFLARTSWMQLRLES